MLVRCGGGSLNLKCYKPVLLNALTGEELGAVISSLTALTSLDLLGDSR